MSTNSLRRSLASDVRGVSTCLDAGLDAISLMAALTGAAAEAKLEQLLSKNRYFELAEVRPQAMAACQCCCIATSLHGSCFALAQVSADPSTCDKRYRTRGVKWAHNMAPSRNAWGVM